MGDLSINQLPRNNSRTGQSCQPGQKNGKRPQIHSYILHLTSSRWQIFLKHVMFLWFGNFSFAIFSCSKCIWAQISLRKINAIKWIATSFSDEFGFSCLGQGPWKVWTAVENQRKFRLDGFGAPSANWQVQTKVRKVQFSFFFFFNITWPAVSPKKSKITSSRGNFFSRFHDSCPPCGRLKNSQNMQHSENGESQNSNDSQAVSFSMWCFSHIWWFFF